MHGSQDVRESHLFYDKISIKKYFAALGAGLVN